MASIIRTDALQNLNTSNIITQTNATTITVGASGQTISIPAGATLTNNGTASGFGLTWQTIITGATLTAVAGRGYWINTTSNACTITLPASATNGDTIILADYLRTWGTNAVTINQNSLNFQGYSSPNPIYNTSGQSVTLVYSGATQGWIPTVDDDVTNETPQPYSVDFLVIAGGGGGGRFPAGQNGGGGGGAGGYRNSYSTEPSGGGGPSEASLSFTQGVVYTVTVGAGGAGGTSNTGISGSDSSISGTGISTITSSGGGGGGGQPAAALSGGSGGGGADGGGIGSGTANQGFGGGGSFGGVPARAGGGGGGASAVGVTGTSSAGGAGGAGLSSSITGSSVARGGGGGAGTINNTSGAGGTGGGGAGGFNTTGGTGTSNTGGGGGGGGGNSGPSFNGGAGGSGVVILRMPTANYSGTTTGSPTVTTDGSDKVIVFNSSGTITG
jgi:hypothetical protein